MTASAIQTGHGLENLLEEFASRLEAGEAVDIAAFAAAHPEQEEQLRRVLPTMLVLADLGRSASASGAAPRSKGADSEPAAGVLGDFRIIREVGRGGMGIVYEAEQISLSRRVALKVLPFAATMDPRHLQRFQNEARAAAGLHHTNIVPVYAVGCERSVHFYVMQFIDGQTLAALIAQMRQRVGHAPPAEDQPTTPHLPDVPPADTAERAAGSTERPTLDAAHFRRVAELGVQAAEALDHAHQMGIVHRDVKPANLLVDAAGRVWITDFGLAQVQSDARLTMTGDLVGTLRYMSPEQALAKRVVIDHRTDIYSLGATLYELLTLQPVFDGADRQELLRQLAFEEPKAPRRINKAIPADLETIVLKALEKNPADRYATARELADDLRRWLEDRPIQARRPTLSQRAVKWSQRHRAAVLTAAALVALGTLAALVALWLVGAARADTAEARRQAAEDSRAQAVEENERTETQLRDTLSLVNQMLRTRDIALTLSIRNAKDVHREQAEEALAYLQALPADRTFRADTRRELARAYQEVGAIFCQMGGDLAADATARHTCEHALALFHALEATDPARAAAYRRERSLVYVTLAWSHDASRRRRTELKSIEPLALLEMGLAQRGNGYQYFLAAIAHAERGELDKACEWYEQGVRWISDHGPANADLLRYRAEAAALLAIEDLPPK